METATTFPYEFDGTPLPGTIRNNASITILSHSNYIGKPYGPNPKATFVGEVLPCAQPDTSCTYTQGYRGNRPNVLWPDPYSRDAVFYSGQTWQQVMDTAVNVSQGYYQLDHQYIAAVPNNTHGTSVPTGVQTTLGLAYGRLSANDPSACTANGS